MCGTATDRHQMLFVTRVSLEAKDFGPDRDRCCSFGGKRIVRGPAQVDGEEIKRVV